MKKYLKMKGKFELRFELSILTGDCKRLARWIELIFGRIVCLKISYPTWNCYPNGVRIRVGHLNDQMEKEKKSKLHRMNE